MMRALLVVLALANVGYWLWSQGDLAAFGAVPASLSEREPRRLSTQINPQQIELGKPVSSP